MQRRRLPVLLLTVVFSVLVQCQKAVSMPYFWDMKRIQSFGKGFQKTDATQHWDIESQNWPCDWEGVTCVAGTDITYANELITEINLPNLNLVGIMDFWPGGPRKLRVFNITGNSFSGKITVNITHCSDLEVIDISRNRFDGTLPENLGDLNKLRTLSVSYNQLTGEFPGPACDGESIDYVDMSWNMLNGMITDQISKCGDLQVLLLNNNGLHGNLPTAMQQLTQLKILDLSHNRLTGPLPDTRQMKSLRKLIVNDNLFSGSIPGSITTENTLLQEINLSNNQIVNTIPTNIGELSSLRSLILSNNKLQGSIPDSFGKLISLTTFYARNNMLTGSIPSSIGSLVRLANMDISFNRLSHLPSSWGTMYSLGTLDISYNQLGGSMPSFMANFQNLYYLNLSHNNIGGQIPYEIRGAGMLMYLDLSYNKLTGSIPTTVSNLHRLLRFNASHNQLTGSLPSALADMTNADVFDISYNSLSGQLPDVPIFRKWFQLGYLQGMLNANGLCGPVVNISCPSPPGPPPSPPPPQLPRSNSTQWTKTLQSSLVKFLQSKKDKLNFLPFFLASVIGVAILGIMAACWISKRIWPRSYEERLDYWELKCSPVLQFCGRKTRLSYRDLQLATEHFSNSNVIGVGSRSKVFLGELSRRGHVAIKVFKEEIIQEIQPHFLEDCRILKMAKHRNVMSLHDWCYKSDFLATIYEHMERGSLHDNIYGKPDLSPLTWEERVGVALDIAIGLAYLHELGMPKRYVSCQLCPSNVLLDEQCVAKISGLRVVKESDADLDKAADKAVETNMVLDNESESDEMDFKRYLAPECTSEAEVNAQAEVFSYGLTVLELIMPASPYDNSLPNIFRQLFPNNLETQIDLYIQKTAPDFTKVLALIELALFCTEDDPEERPNMVTVVDVLIKIRSGELDTSHFLSP